MPYARLETITARLHELLVLVRSGRYSTPELARRLGVSEQTVYRDILSLKERGYRINAVRRKYAWAYRVSGEPRPDRAVAALSVLEHSQIPVQAHRARNSRVRHAGASASQGAGARGEDNRQ